MQFYGEKKLALQCLRPWTDVYMIGTLVDKGLKNEYHIIGHNQVLITQFVSQSNKTQVIIFLVKLQSDYLTTLLFFRIVKLPILMNLANSLSSKWKYIHKKPYKGWRILRNYKIFIRMLLLKCSPKVWFLKKKIMKPAKVRRYTTKFLTNALLKVIVTFFKRFSEKSLEINDLCEIMKVDTISQWKI